MRSRTLESSKNRPSCYRGCSNFSGGGITSFLISGRSRLSLQITVFCFESGRSIWQESVLVGFLNWRSGVLTWLPVTYLVMLVESCSGYLLQSFHIMNCRYLLQSFPIMNCAYTVQSINLEPPSLFAIQINVNSHLGTCIL